MGELALGAAVFFGLFISCCVIAVVRRLNRGTSGEPPVVISLLVAEELARRTRKVDGVMILVALAVLAVAWAAIGEWSCIAGVWVVIRFGDYAVAHRALAILELPRVVAELYGTNLVVRGDGKQSAVMLTRRAIRRAKQAAVPTAKTT